MNSGNTLQSTIGQWMNSLDNPESQRILYYDNVTWPNNAPCSGVKSEMEIELRNKIKFLDQIYHPKEREITFYTFLN